MDKLINENLYYLAYYDLSTNLLTCKKDTHNQA